MDLKLNIAVILLACYSVNGFLGNSLPGPRKLTDEISGFEKYIENDIKERGEDNAMIADERAPLDSSVEDLKLLRILQNVLDTNIQTGDERSRKRGWWHKSYCSYCRYTSKKQKPKKKSKFKWPG